MLKIIFFAVAIISFRSPLLGFCEETDLRGEALRSSESVYLPSYVIREGYVLDYVDVRARGDDKDSKLHVDLDGQSIGWNRIGKSDSSNWNRIDVEHYRLTRRDRLSLRAKDAGDGRVYVYKVDVCYY